MCYLKGEDDDAKKKSEPPGIPNADNAYPSLLQHKKSSVSRILVSGGLGVSGAIGIGTVGSYNQWSVYQYGVIYFVEVFVIIILYSLPYLLEAYKIHEEYKNDNPTENEKERNHEKEMKKMEYDFLLKMKEIEIMETSPNNISELQTKNE